MGILKSKTEQYEFSPKDIVALIAADLGVELPKISVHYEIQEVGGDPLDRYPGTNTVTKIRVTVDRT